MKGKPFGTGPFTFGEGMVHAAELGVKLKKWRAAAAIGPRVSGVQKTGPAGRAPGRHADRPTTRKGPKART